MTLGLGHGPRPGYWRREGEGGRLGFGEVVRLEAVEVVSSIRRRWLIFKDHSACDILLKMQSKPFQLSRDQLYHLGISNHGKLPHNDACLDVYQPILRHFLVSKVNTLAY